MSRQNSSGSLWIDFLTFWGIRVPLWWSLIDWFRVFTGIGISLSVGALVVSLIAIAVTSGWLSLPVLAELICLN